MRMWFVMSLFSKILKSQNLKNRSALCFTSVAITVVLSSSGAFAKSSAKKNFTHSFAAFDQESLEFTGRIKGMNAQEECLPILVGHKKQVDIHFLHCSEAAKIRDSQARRINNDLIVPAGISHRFNFWRRVYSLWSKEQHVLHAAEYPEVVFEFWDVSRFNYGRQQEDRVIKELKNTRRREYAKLLITMYYGRHKPASEMTPAMKRIADLMAHIDHPDKYLRAANSLRLQRGQREYIESGLKVAPLYMPYIEEEFEKQGVPKVFAKLAFIESSFNLQARSKVGASGVFQIMPETGRQYLIMTDGVDERNDPIKAARAAAKLLQLNFSILGQWPLAITAYNHGVGGIRRAVNSAGTSDIVELIKRYDGPNFGFASKNFYAGYLGLLATLENSRRIFPAVPQVEPMKYETIRAGGVSLADVKKKYKLSNWQIANLNPDLNFRFIKNNGVLPPRYVLKVPGMQPSSQLLSQNSPASRSRRR